jgi:predicted ATP-dependent endonuclease of OLD family
LSGYDTLRLILAKKAVLVEGPSDELVFQKAYQRLYNRLPIDDGVDVINVRGLSFARFLDIAAILNIPVVVLTDNDGNYAKNVAERYSTYTCGNSVMKVFSPKDDSQSTLELCLVGCNNLATLNHIFGQSFADAAAAAAYLLANKTEAALRLFDTDFEFTMPTYVLDAAKSLV